MGWNWWCSRSKPRPQEVLCCFALSLSFSWTPASTYGDKPEWIHWRYVRNIWRKAEPFQPRPPGSASPQLTWSLTTDTWVSPDEINQAQPRSPELWLLDLWEIINGSYIMPIRLGYFYTIKANCYVRLLWLYPPLIHPRIHFLVKSSLSGPDYFLGPLGSVFISAHENLVVSQIAPAGYYYQFCWTLLFHLACWHCTGSSYCSIFLLLAGTLASTTSVSRCQSFVQGRMTKLQKCLVCSVLCCVVTYNTPDILKKFK